MSFWILWIQELGGLPYKINNEKNRASNAILSFYVVDCRDENTLGEISSKWRRI